MTAMFLLDSNILAEATRPQPNTLLLQRLQQHAGALATSAIVWHELHFGLRRLPASRRRRTVEAYIEELAASDLAVLPYDERAAEWHAAERARLQALGTTPLYADGQIAATAAVNSLVLVTCNLKDFQHFDGLVVTDWTQQR